jgi:nitroreductase
MDVTIALQNMVIAAWLQGVGSCWIGAWNDAKLRETLNLPADSKIVGLVTFGMPDEEPAQQPKRSLNEIIHLDEW